MRIVFAGTGEFGVPCLEALVASDEHFVLSVITQPDRPAGRQQKVLPSPIKECALRHQLTVFQPEDVNSPTALSQIRYQKPDLMVVVAYGQILKKNTFGCPRQGLLECPWFTSSEIPRSFPYCSGHPRSAKADRGDDHADE